MYELFDTLNMLPSDAYRKVSNMSKSEKIITLTFLKKKKENKKDGFCPLIGGENIG